MKHLVVAADPSRSVSDQLVPALEGMLGHGLGPGEWEQMLWQGCVYADKVRVRDPAQTTKGTLEVFYPELPVTEFVLSPARVVYQDDDILAVDKPAGVNTAPSPYSDRDCLTWGVENYLASGFAVHAVHRLDRDTSGLVLFAKNKPAELGLHALFRRRRILKVYRAVTPIFSDSPLELPGRSTGSGDSLDWRGKVQLAATTVVRAGEKDGTWLWWALPHTGRPHQIRKHFALYLVPLVNDKVYGGDPAAVQQRGDLGLRCVLLRFAHPVTGRRMEVAL